MKIKVGDWVLVTKRSEDGLDCRWDYSDEEPKYLYNIGSGGKVISVDKRDVLVEFYWGKYNYQNPNYKNQALELGLPEHKGGWYVSKYCLTVLPKKLKINEMKAIARLMI